MGELALGLRFGAVLKRALTLAVSTVVALTGSEALVWSIAPQQKILLRCLLLDPIVEALAAHQNEGP